MVDDFFEPFVLARFDRHVWVKGCWHASFIELGQPVFEVGRKPNLDDVVLVTRVGKYIYKAFLHRASISFVTACVANFVSTQINIVWTAFQCS